MGEVDFLRSCVNYVYLTDVKSGNIGQVHKSGDKISAVFCLCKGYAWNFQHPEGSMAWLICFFFVVTKTFVSSCWFHFPSLHFLDTIFLWSFVSCCRLPLGHSHCDVCGIWKSSFEKIIQKIAFSLAKGIMMLNKLNKTLKMKVKTKD